MSMEPTSLANALAKLNARQTDVLLSTTKTLSAPWPAERWGTTAAAFEVLLLRAVLALDGALMNQPTLLLTDAEEQAALAQLKIALTGSASNRYVTLLRALEAHHVELLGRVEALRRTELAREASSPWRYVRQAAFVLLLPISAYLFWKNEPETVAQWTRWAQALLGGK